MTYLKSINIEKGKAYRLDAGFKNTSKVMVHNVGEIYAEVSGITNWDNKWHVMKNRLSELPTKQNEI